MKTKEKLQEELIKILQSFVPNLQNDEYNKLKIELAELKEEEKDPNVVCDQYHMRGKWIKEE